MPDVRLVDAIVLEDARLVDAIALEQAIINEYFTDDRRSGILSRKGEIIFNSAIDVARCRVRDAETVDVLQVVRCKQCRSNLGVKSGDGTRILCTAHHRWTDENGFCHMGEKMERKE